MVKAHGGSRTIVNMDNESGLTLGGLITNTTTGMDKDVHMKGLDRLISQTTGVPREEPIMEGVIKSTVPSSMKMTPELHKVSAKEVGKTQAKRMGQVPYAGSKY
jgi:hypothetical protein